MYCERKGKGFRLIVAIADVSHYVRDGDALDADARERGTSVYFPRRVIPMLPEELSNGLCSLKPKVDRLCMVCDMQISARARSSRYAFYPAVMHSQARLTYTQVWDWLSAGKAAKARRREARCCRTSQNLYAVYQGAGRRRARSVARSTSTPSRSQIDVRRARQDRADRAGAAQRRAQLIEECMLAANVCAADFLHEAPAARRFTGCTRGRRRTSSRRCASFSAVRRCQLGGGDDAARVGLRQAADAGPATGRILQLLQTVLLRSLSQAQYSPENVGHFGLAYDAYAHFTSPIRRYPDLLVHRAIKAVLAGKRYTPQVNRGTRSACTAR